MNMITTIICKYYPIKKQTGKYDRDIISIE